MPIMSKTLTQNSLFQGYTDNVPREQFEQENLANPDHVSIL